jgi:hypothetical protein
MKVCNNLGNDFNYHRGFCFRKSYLEYPIEEFSSWEKIHEEIDVVSILIDVMKGNNVEMVGEAEHDFHFFGTVSLLLFDDLEKRGKCKLVTMTLC